MEILLRNSTSFVFPSRLTKAKPNDALAGIMCFAIPLVLNVVVLAAYITKKTDNVTTAATALDLVRAFRDPITSILVSRFLLELCELSSKTPTHGETKLGDIISSDITLHPSDVLSDLPEDQRTIRDRV
uniref:Copper transport protein CTR1 n=1 Tax=Ganoderma boninense TaxID=34458 RepID=A0A5K1K6L0_9APHY|nr:Copper transport protein CTR1 [Ganoderma boninense]